jgi:hypothetical protein
MNASDLVFDLPRPYHTLDAYAHRKKNLQGLEGSSIYPHKWSIEERSTQQFVLRVYEYNMLMFTVWAST